LRWVGVSLLAGSAAAARIAGGGAVLGDQLGRGLLADAGEAVAGVVAQGGEVGVLGAADRVLLDQQGFVGEMQIGSHGSIDGLQAE
jgi:hypothetical protein